jgi:hypothetical protein
MNFLKLKTTKKHVFSTLFVFVLTVLPSQAVFADTFSVSTGGATKMSDYIVILDGYVQTSTDDGISNWFEYGKNNTFGLSTYKSGFHRSGGSSVVVTGIDQNITYSYRAVAQNERTGSKAYGEIKTFIIEGQNITTNISYSNNTTYNNTNNTSNTTSNIGSGNTNTINSSATNPVVSTVGDDIGSNGNTVSLKGMVSAGKTSPITTWFQFGETKDFGSETIHKNISTEVSPLSFNETISGLKTNTTYYYRAVAQTGAGIGYGTVMSFSTSGNSGLFGKIFGGTSSQVAATQESSRDTSLALGNTTDGNASSQSKEISKTLAWGKVLKTQSFTVDKNGSVAALKDVETNSSKKGNFLTAAVFSVGSVMPSSFLGWLVWVLILYVLISQLRSSSAKRKKAKEESDVREAEMKEMRKKQEQSLANGRKPAIA